MRLMSFTLCLHVNLAKNWKSFGLRGVFLERDFDERLLYLLHIVEKVLHLSDTSSANMFRNFFPIIFVKFSRIVELDFFISTPISRFELYKMKSISQILFYFFGVILQQGLLLLDIVINLPVSFSFDFICDIPKFYPVSLDSFNNFLFLLLTPFFRFLLHKIFSLGFQYLKKLSDLRIQFIPNLLYTSCFEYFRDFISIISMFKLSLNQQLLFLFRPLNFFRLTTC